MLDKNTLLDAGSLRYRITIQQRSATTSDDYGQPDASWKNVTNAWASITDATGRELFSSNQLTSQITHVIKMRYQPSVSITAGMQVLGRTRVFDIQAVQNVNELNKITKLLVLEISNNNG